MSKHDGVTEEVTKMERVGWQRFFEPLFSLLASPTTIGKVLRRDSHFLLVYLASLFLPFVLVPAALLYGAWSAFAQLTTCSLPHVV